MKPCKRGHLPERRSKATGHCLDCRALQRLANDGQIRQSRKDHYQRNAEAIKRKSREWHAANRKRASITGKAWAKNNPEKVKAAIARYHERHPHVLASNVAKRSAAKSQRTPSWLTDVDKMIMKNFYRHSRKLSENTGIQHNVDHIIPLRGELVSGLHVPWNMQVITRDENYRKNHRYIP